MALDLILRNARLASAGPEQPTVDIGVQHGRIVAIEPHLTAEGPAHDAGGKLVSPGLIESHFHLDKARLIDRVPLQPNRMVRDHMERTAAIKQTFTPDEMYARAQATLEQCLLHGVTHMRTQVEVDPNVGLLGFEVIEQLRQDYAWAIDLQPCVFLQEGWTDVPGADENLVACLERGAPVVGGGIRYDTDGPGQIRRVFALAQHYDVDVDFHLDGGYDVQHWITRSCARSRSRWGGRAGSPLGMGPNFPVCRSQSKPPSGSGSARLACPWRSYQPPTSSMRDGIWSIA